MKKNRRTVEKNNHILYGPIACHPCHPLACQASNVHLPAVGSSEKACSLHIFGARCHRHFARSVNIIPVGSLFIFVIFAGRTDCQHPGNKADYCCTPADEQGFTEDISVNICLTLKKLETGSVVVNSNSVGVPCSCDKDHETRCNS